MISYKGKLSVLVALPIFAQLFGAIDLVGMNAEVVALFNASLTATPPSIVGIAAIAAAISAAISAGFQPPVFDFKANFLLKWSLLKARYELLLKLQNLVTSGSVRLYEYEGQAGAFGSELSTMLAGSEVDGGIPPTKSTFAVLLVAEGGTAGETTLKALRGGA